MQRSVEAFTEEASADAACESSLGYVRGVFRLALLLDPEQVLVQAGNLRELLMRPLLDDPPLLEDEDAVRPPDGG